MQFVLRSSTRDSNLRAGHTLTGDGQAIVNHVNPSLLERSPLMDNENMIETAESNEFGELFEELSVTELEDRLELAARCVCRNEN
jgi:hypothetical protein